MASSFAVTTTTGSINIGSGRQSSVSYTVTNRRGGPCRGRVSVVALEGAQQDWFWIPGEIERPFQTGETHQFPVEVRIPANAQPGPYALRLDVVAEDNPDEDYTQGPVVAFTVFTASEPIPDEPAGYLRTIVGAAIGAFAGTAGGGLVALIMVALAVVLSPLETFFGVLAVAALVIGPWGGAAAGSWQALRMGDYTRARRTGLIMLGALLVWSGLSALIIWLFASINGTVAVLFTLIIMVPAWVVVPALSARFATLRIGASRRAGTTSSQPVST